MIYSSPFQATHCRQTPCWTGRWFSPSSVHWFRARACPDNIEGLAGLREFGRRRTDLGRDAPQRRDCGALPHFGDRRRVGRCPVCDPTSRCRWRDTDCAPGPCINGGVAPNESSSSSGGTHEYRRGNRWIRGRD